MKIEIKLILLSTASLELFSLKFRNLLMSVKYTAQFLSNLCPHKPLHLKLGFFID